MAFDTPSIRVCVGLLLIVECWPCWTYTGKQKKEKMTMTNEGETEAENDREMALRKE